jgi:hypothetical protein
MPVALLERVYEREAQWRDLDATFLVIARKKGVGYRSLLLYPLWQTSYLYILTVESRWGLLQSV